MFANANETSYFRLIFFNFKLPCVAAINILFLPYVPFLSLSLFAGSLNMWSTLPMTGGLSRLDERAILSIFESN